MTRLRAALLLLCLLTFVLIVIVTLTQVQTVAGNPFQAYDQWLPGQPMPKGEAEGCTLTKRPYPTGLYIFCHPDGGAFSSISLYGDYRLVTGLYFFPRSMRGGDLMLWFGEPQQVKRMGQTWAFYWRTISAYTRRGTSRYEAKVIMVWRKGNNE